MPSNPETYNVNRTDEIVRETACKAAKYASKLLDEAENGQQIVGFDSHIEAMGVLINGCGNAMLFPDKDSPVADFDD